MSSLPEYPPIETKRPTATAKAAGLSIYTDAHVPNLIQGAGKSAKKHFLDFFASTIANDNTRSAYRTACNRFLDWCESVGVYALIDIEPAHVGAYRNLLDDYEYEPDKRYKAPTIKQHLAGIRMMFSYLVVKQVIAENPAMHTRGPKHSATVGETRILSTQQARNLIKSIELVREVDYRDRALIAVMMYTFARVSAALNCKIGDYFSEGGQKYLALLEKGGKKHRMPVHGTLAKYLDEYIEFAEIGANKDGFLFRASSGRWGQLKERKFNRKRSYEMVRKRAAGIGLTERIGNHSLRGTGITSYLNNGGALEEAQKMAAHSSPRTTKLYDRTDQDVTIIEVNRIPI